MAGKAVQKKINKKINAMRAEVNKNLKASNATMKSAPAKKKVNTSVKMSTKYGSSGVTSPGQLGRMNPLDRSFFTGVPLKVKKANKK